MNWLSKGVLFFFVFAVLTPVYTQNVDFKDPVPEVFRTPKKQPKFDPLKAVQKNHQSNHGNMPYYPPNASPEQSREITKRYVDSKMKAGMPTKENGFKSKTPQQLAHQEMMKLLNESHRKNQILKKSNHSVSPRYYKDIPNYQRAKQEIKDQLADKKPISIKDAYFYAESAYGGLQLNYEEYNQTIENNKQYILNWLKQEGYAITNPEMLHYGIQSFLSDTLNLKINNPDNVLGGAQTLIHLPFSYDYIDYASVKDRRNYFVSKTFATGTGQCHTLPVTYLVMAEALQVEASLSYNPDHSFIQYRNNEGTLLNYETTIGRFIPDQVYMDMMPTMAKAHHNNVFINRLTKKQLLSTILIDLSVNFIFEHWFADEEIVNDCIVTAEKYFPNREYINTSSLWIKKKCLSQDFNRLVEEKGITDLNEIDKYPEVKQAYLELKKYLERTQQLGIEPFPEKEYIQIMAYHDENERLQISKSIDTKSKRDLFIRK